MKHHINLDPKTIKFQNKIAKMYFEIVLFCEKELKKNDNAKGYQKSIFSSSNLCKINKISIIQNEVNKMKQLFKESEYDFCKDRNFFISIKNSYSTIPSLLIKLRNSIAHGNFEIKKIGKKNFFIFFDEDRNKNLTMKGQIEEKIFFDFISELKKSKK